METVNYPLTKTVLSAEGSAEVIARGTNEYTALWATGLSAIGGNLNDTWSLWDTFPTVVRFGNFVYCWHKIVSSHSYYILIDVVKDPTDGNALGNNLAFRELSNDRLDNVANILIDPSVITASATAGPYTPLAIENKITDTLSTPACSFISANRSIDQITPVFTNGTITDMLIGCNTSDIANMPAIKGYGDHAILIHTDETIASHGTFAPFATKKQFESVYGKESDWVITPHSTQEQWLFDNSSNTSYTVAYANGAGLTYPFTVAAMIPNTLYRDVAGDTTGDGIDNTPSLEDALAVYAIATAVVPSLDPTKCIGFPGDLSIAGIDINSIKDKINGLKGALDAAIDSAALSALGETLKGVKADLLGLLPKMPTIHNLSLEILGIDPKDLDAINKLNEKWKGVAGDLKKTFDDFTNFDICSLIGIKAKDGDDGEIVKKPEAPALPDTEISSSADHKFYSKSARGLPQSDFMAAAGMTPALAEEAQQKYNSLWQKLADDDTYVWAGFLKNGPKYEKEFKAYQEQNDYVTGREATAKKVKITTVLSPGRITQMRKEITPLTISHSNSSIMNAFFVFARHQLWRHMLWGTDQRAPNDYFPTTNFNPSDMWKGGQSAWPDIGSIPEPAKNFLKATNMDAVNKTLVEKFWPQMVEAIKKYLFSEEGVQTQLQLISYWAEHYQNEGVKQRILVELDPPGPVHPTVEDANAEALKSLVSPVAGVPMDDVSMIELGAGDTMLPAAGVMPPPPPKK